MEILNNNAIQIIKRNLKRYGKEIEFKKPIVNKYNEVSDEFEITTVQKCLYHVSEYSGNNRILDGDSGENKAVKIEMLLTEYNEEIKVNDFCNISNKLYRIFDVINYNEDYKIIDVCLEAVGNELVRRT